ncbi:MAG: Uma2 family endonuclease [Turicibacter sp.]|nr:Uma2 family endonuclease [Turicibacter sp.]
MIELLNMGWTSDRHTDLNNLLGLEILTQVRMRVLQKKSFYSQGTTRLVYSGAKFSDLAELFNANDFPTSQSLHDFYSVEPDILLFHHNKFKINSNGTLIAGYPDLVVEIWSEHNTEQEKRFKKMLYATSGITEHWYLTQSDFYIERYLGTVALPQLHLSDVITTESGLVIDMRDLVKEWKV